MTPAVVGRGDVLEEQRLQRQMGCMAGFFQLFDRHHFITGRRGYSTRRLPTSSSAGSTSPSERSEVSSALLFKESYPPPPSSPEPCSSSTEDRAAAAETPGRRSLPLPLQVFEANDGGTTSWRIRDGPRFSLDSRLVVDARGKLRPREIRTGVPISSENQFDTSEAAEEQLRSPSVVARLMGLDGLPSNGRMYGAEPDQTELRRSASESRVRNNQSSYGLIHTSSVREASPPPESAPITAEFFKSVSLAQFKLNNTEPTKMSLRTTQSPPLQRKIFFDPEDFFPESKMSGSLNGDIEKRLRLRGIEEPAKDMETVKQILEALQLKGLLRSNRSHPHGSSRRNLIYDYQSRLQTDAPIVITRPVSKTKQRASRESQPFQPRARTGRQSPQHVPRGLPVVDRAVEGGSERRNRGPSSAVSRRHLNAAAHSSAQPQRRISTVSSQKSSPKRTGPDSLAVRSPRNRRPTADASSEAKLYATAEDDTSTMSTESSAGSSSQLECERSNVDCSSGRSLLERCDKLLSSISAFTGVEQVIPADQQPSPVSVLDSLSLLGDEGSRSPSSLVKHSVDFRDKSTDDWEELRRFPPASTISWDSDYGPEELNHEYAYVSEIIRLCDRYGDACDAVNAIPEKRCGVDSCKGASLHRRLFFDTVSEILDRKRWVTPWDSSRLVTFSSEKELLRHVWGELRRIQEPGAANMDDAEVGGALRKDIDGQPADGWVRPSAETYDAIVHIERLIFKDLVAETIGELASANVDVCRLLPRRKLYFQKSL